MASSLTVARNVLRYMGKSSSQVRAMDKSFSDYLKALVAGKSKKEKKAFYKAYQTFINNPGSNHAKTDLERHIANSTFVERAEQLGGEYLGPSNRLIATHGLQNRLVAPIRLHKTMRDIGKQAALDMRTALNETCQNIITPEKLTSIASDTVKEIMHEYRVLAGRRLMYPINKLIASGFSKEFKNLFNGIIELPKAKFGHAYYANLVKSKGLLGKAPKEVVVSEKAARTSFNEIANEALGIKQKYHCEGGFNIYENTISFTKEFSTLPKWLQTNLITHELKHFEQVKNVIEAFGLERYIKALKTNGLNTLKASKNCAGKSEAELMKLVEDEWVAKGLEQKVRKAFAEISDISKIQTTQEIQQAQTYLEAIENYVGTGNGIFVDVSKSYTKNPMEVEAYKIGNRSGLKAFILQNLNLKTA